MHIPEGAEETAKDLILQLRERGFQNDAEITEEVPVQQDKLTIVIPRESLTDMTRDAKRVSSKLTETDNDKYAFRCFLLRLGFIGKEYKTAREILLRKLTGNS